MVFSKKSIFAIRNPGGFLIRLRLIVIFCLALFSSVVALTQANDDAKPLPTIADKTKQLKKLDGFFPVYWDERKGKIWLEISRWNAEFLFLDSLPAGIGSNDIGLDRGQLGEGRVVEFERIGPRVLLKQLNLNYRASSENPAERRSVEDAFAQSVLWGFEVAAEDNDRVLVDATAFFMSDAHHVDRDAQENQAGDVQVRGVALGNLPRQHEEFSPEHRSRGDPHLRPRQRRTRQVGAGRDARSQRHHRARALFLRAASGQQLPAARLRSALRLHSTLVRRLQRSRWPTARAALHPSPSPGEERSNRRGQRSGEAHRLLPRSRHARADSFGAAGRRELVEPGVRSGRVSQCLSRRDAARRTPIPWMSATTTFSGCIARRAAGRTARPSSIRERARSSRATSRSARCAHGRTTSSSRDCWRPTNRVSPLTRG